ncbi:beta-1,3-galactosyltransferase 5 [Nematostella vectensis]|uniref:beta-1,3-galactosyltransferase 5 n=1 Tax=Nematostella vectensis TaxID=45351 RepID=UPI0020772267|nr:beta-1,3-galactosyltransferase 5 [Nematostella vectensis]
MPSKRFKAKVLLPGACILLLSSIYYMSEDSKIIYRDEKEKIQALRRNENLQGPSSESRFSHHTTRKNKPIQQDIQVDRVPSSLVAIERSYQSALQNFRTNLHSLKLAANKDHDVIRTLAECERKPFLLILVHTKPGSFARREAIRQSWGRPDRNFNQMHNVNNRSWKTVFLIGKSRNKFIQSALAEESKRSRDVIFGSFEESYPNLYKKMVLGIEWPQNNCPADYILKTDDDCYVSVQALITWLDSYHVINASQPLYTGNLALHSKAIRDSSHRNYLSRDQYPEEEFPAYISGGGYLFSGFLLPRLISGSKRVKMFPVEDACFGTIMNEIRVRPTADLRFLPFIFCGFDRSGVYRPVYALYRPLCELLGPFVIHGLRPEGQITLHYNVRIMTAVSSICSQYQRNAWLRARRRCVVPKQQRVSALLAKARNVA